SCVHNEHVFSFTVSCGLVELCNNEPYGNAVNRADALLYQAKSEGRNRVVAVPNTGADARCAEMLACSS
ncbi:MAG TPA: hypothetical protein VFF99_07840, partial [Noviherbaspirillum sp.]|nr:hypothetical protein [Noviherbaspirillum sp.]